MTRKLCKNIRSTFLADEDNRLKVLDVLLAEGVVSPELRQDMNRHFAEFMYHDQRSLMGTDQILAMDRIVGQLRTAHTRASLGPELLEKLRVEDLEVRQTIGRLYHVLSERQLTSLEFENLVVAIKAADKLSHQIIGEHDRLQTARSRACMNEERRRQNRKRMKIYAQE